MEESKKESAEAVNKVKKCKKDAVTQAVLSYLEKRNYPMKGFHKLSLQEFELEKLVQCEVSRPNSILYSCINSDPVIDQTFLKFVNWLKEVNKTCENSSDLDCLKGPLFCHLYFEILDGEHKERAASFFANHKHLVDKTKTFPEVVDVMNSVAENSENLMQLKENFQSHKFSIALSTNSVNLLKQYLFKFAHIVLFQILQNYFDINEINVFDENMKDLSSDNCEARNINVKHNVKSDCLKRLQDSISALKEDVTPVFVTNLINVKDEVTCGLIKRQFGVALFSYNNKIVIRSIVTLKQFEDVELLGHNKRIYDLSYIDQLNCVLSASEDKTIRLYDLNNYSLKNVYVGHHHPVYSVKSCKNAEYFISGSYDYTARLWTVERRNCLRVFAGHTQAITCVDTHPNCTYFASGSSDSNVRVWTLEDHMPVRLFVGGKGTVYCVIFNNGGNYVISASDDRKIRIWDLVGGKEVTDIDTDGDVVTHLALTKDDKILVTGTNQGVIKYWNFEEIVKTQKSSKVDVVKQFSLNSSKLLNIEYCFDTMGFLTHEVLR